MIIHTNEKFLITQKKPENEEAPVQWVVDCRRLGIHFECQYESTFDIFIDINKRIEEAVEKLGGLPKLLRTRDWRKVKDDSKVIVYSYDYTIESFPLSKREAAEAAVRLFHELTTCTCDKKWKKHQKDEDKHQKTCPVSANSREYSWEAFTPWIDCLHDFVKAEAE